MFTGIIEETGKVLSIKKGSFSAILTVQCSVVIGGIKEGDSIAVNGVCLTATSIGSSSFCADVMHETMNRSSLGFLRPGSLVNLERAMAADGRFGGHIVSGHVDGTGIISSVRKDGNAVWYTVRTSPDVLRYIVEKGSITIDGISLTVAKVDDNNFSVSVIPHTSQHTALTEKRTGDIVNLENDVIGKYVEKLLGTRSQSSQQGISKEFLYQYGY
ncbi:riboflavin synthase [Clostridium sp. AM58-1XD]|uniref:riboflavin synthase n=1 Tax=Clostridium sp. AM58-1XD TaxID=2292307 RepID=UPI000E478FB4|nr:riboflavin synthase [Clostridium sp. AM58-1XD]RGY98111.1 riboflavin synthase [Clostridium sp. AM58-1XD]